MKKTTVAPFEQVIKRVTDIWEAPIFNFLEKKYTCTWIPSHDIKHHQRVWLHAVKICRDIHLEYGLDFIFYNELILCCYFHDTGMLIDRGEQHGKESRKIAEEFLSLNGDLAKSKINKERLLKAIENHDDKTYQSSEFGKNRLLEILSLADDIDALGAVGLYRYIEIYLIRGIEVEKIPDQILSNVRRRYINLVNCLEKYKLPIDPYAVKYNDLEFLIKKDTFFDEPASLVRWIEKEIVLIKGFSSQIIQSKLMHDFDNKRINAFVQLFDSEYKN